MLDTLSPPRRRLVIASLLLVLVLVAVLASVALSRTSRSSGRAGRGADQARPGPVLLVPGYGGSEIGLQTLAASLRAAGKQVSILGLPDGGTGDLHAQARALDAAARAAAASSAAGSVDVVGYSAGGVVARLWVTDFGGGAIARRIITLGSPHHGTELADLGALFAGACPVACQQLSQSSSLLAALNGEPAPAVPSFVSIWSTSDDVVVPVDSARLPGAVNVTVQSVCPASSLQHSQLPTSPVVAGMVLAELAPGAPTALSTADCHRFGG